MLSQWLWLVYMCFFFQITTTTTTTVTVAIGKVGGGGQKIFLPAVLVRPARPCFRHLRQQQRLLQWKMNGRWTRPTLYAFVAAIINTTVIKSQQWMWLTVTMQAPYPTRTSTMSTPLKFYPSSINSWRTNAAPTALLTNLWLLPLLLRPKPPILTRTRNSIQLGHVLTCLSGVTLSNTYRPFHAQIVPPNYCVSDGEKKISDAISFFLPSNL